MLTQIDLENDYTEAYNVIARSHDMSRREYVADFLRKSADKVPGLMAKVRSEMADGITQEGDIEMGRPSTVLTEFVAPMKRYRFRPLDGGDPVEGEGTAPGPALAAATGRKWTQEEYEKVYMSPQLIGEV